MKTCGCDRQGLLVLAFAAVALLWLGGCEAATEDGADAGVTDIPAGGDGAGTTPDGTVATADTADTATTPDAAPAGDAGKPDVPATGDAAVADAALVDAGGEDAPAPDGGMGDSITVEDAGSPAPCGDGAPCPAGQWCRATEAGSKECVPFAGAGESCGGKVLPWTQAQCEPALTCVGKGLAVDLPGVCAACSYEGEPHQLGDTFAAGDGCNTCTCMEGGAVACTKMACPGVCPDGSEPVLCFADPCTVSQCGVAGATCTADYCGGCFAVWTDPAGDTVCDGCATDADCPKTEWCRPTEAGDMACVPFVGPGETCGGYTLPWYHDRCQPALQCVGNPLIADLPGVCATCSYQGEPHQSGDTFDAGDGCNTCTCNPDGAVACTKKACPGACPDGTDPVQCFVDPCMVSKCAVPGATCQADYCGGCNAVWTDPAGHQVCAGGCDYEGTAYQAGDVFAASDGCNTCTCTSNGMVACTKMACSACPDGSPPVQCLVDPCTVSKCGVVDATCKADYCGGCFAVWTDPAGNQVCGGGCETDADCADGTWCRQTEAGPRECVPYAGAGEMCGGFTLPWYYQQCDPSLLCVFNPFIADAPGVCGDCDYGGVAYQAGDSFPAGDGCNTCVCDADGAVACTEMFCQ